MTLRMTDKQQIQLAENLKRIMKEKNLKITATAKKVGMNKSTLHGYCNGVVPRNLKKLKELAEFLEVSWSELIFAEKDESKSMIFGGGIEGRYEIIVRRIDERGK